jgi:hypothetical protein
MALGAIIGVLRTKLSLMMVRMAVGAFVMHEFQHTSTRRLGVCLMALLALHQRVFSTELEVGKVVIELLRSHLIPASRHVA